METIQELLIAELKDIYSAEKQIVKALPKIIKGAQSPELKEALTGHLEVTKQQVTRLEEAFALAGEKPKVKHCKGMEGLLEEGSDCLEEEDAGPLRDLQLIGACRRVEHYEVAAYSNAQALAQQADMEQVADLLGQTLAEEKEADETLTEVAESLYGEVSEPGEGEEEEEEEELAGVGASRSASAGSQSKRTVR